ncbi:hypothetical protein [Micromonospora sp. NPDC049102]
MYVLALSELTTDMGDLVGGKAAGLGAPIRHDEHETRGRRG